MDFDKNNKTNISDKMQTRNNDVSLQETNNNDTDDTEAKNVQNDTVTEEKKPKRKITIVVDEDDPCLKQDVEEKTTGPLLHSTFHGEDPRFQQQNQTLRCWVMYTDFYRCERILGTGSSACTWFKDVFTSICPNEWIRRLDELRLERKFPWHKYKTQGEFPGDKYGV